MSNFINEEDIKLEPCDVFWGVRQSTPVTFVADVAGSLDGTYFNINAFDSSYSEVEYYVWFDVDAAGNDPVVAGKTGIAVSVTSGDAASVIAAAAKTAIEAVEDFRSLSISGDIGTILNEYFGECVDAADVDAGVTIGTIVPGKGGALGATDGGVTLTPEVAGVDIMSDQTGEQILDVAMNANNITVEMTLKEVTRVRYSDLIGSVSGDSVLPSGGTEVIGMGESKRFKNLKQYAGELILRPVGAVDNSRNHYLWKASPSVESVNFSGSELQMMPVSFRSFRDVSKDNKVNLWAFGDGTQDLDA